MNNILVKLLNAHTEAINLMNKQEIQKAHDLLRSSHPMTASGEDLDIIAVEVGLPHRRGVSVPDDVLRGAIFKELSGGAGSTSEASGGPAV